MLRFPSERLSIALGSSSIGVMRKQDGDDIETEIIHYAMCDSGNAWQLALGAFDTWLEKVNLRKARVSLLLSDRFLRHALIPWSSVALKRVEDEALILARFEEAHGDMAGWRIVTDRGGYGSARIACAMPGEMIDCLRAQWSTRQIRGGAVVPHFVACWNRWRNLAGTTSAEVGRWAKASSIFAVAESGSLVMGVLAPQGWISLRTLAVPDTSALVNALYRESLLQGYAESLPVRLHIPGLAWEEVAAPLIDISGIEWMGLESKPREAVLSMADLGVGMGWLK